MRGGSVKSEKAALQKCPLHPKPSLTSPPLSLGTSHQPLALMSKNLRDPCNGQTAYNRVHSVTGPRLT